MNENWEENDALAYQKMKRNHVEQWNYISKFIAEKHIKSILDVGCGDSKLYDFSGDWIGIDLNTTIKNDKVITADFLDYKFDREFDMVLIAGVAEHYNNKKLEEFLKVALQTNPKYILITLFIGIREGSSRIFGFITSKKMYSMSRFGTKSIKKIMKKCQLDKYFIEKINHRDRIIVIRRERR